MQLDLLGWDRSFADDFAPWAAAGHRPARVAAAYPGGFLVLTEAGELRARLTGRLRHLAGPCIAGVPAVGDWVCLRTGRGSGGPMGSPPVNRGSGGLMGSPPVNRGSGGPVPGPRVDREGDLALIQAVLPRRSAIAGHRPAVGEQVLAANVDLVLVVAAPGREVDPWRVERLLAQAWEGGARPVLVLAQADRCPDRGTGLATELRLLAAVAPGVPAHAVSCWTGDGLDEVAALLRPGATVVLLGPPGVGKSTLVNRLAGRDLLATGEVRDDGPGRHTTARRQLLTLAGGSLVIDTPGLRELGADPAGPRAAGDRDVLAAAERRRRIRAMPRGPRSHAAEHGRD